MIKFSVVLIVIILPLIYTSCTYKMNIPWKGTCGGSRICEPGLSCKQSSCFKETEVVYLKKCSKDLDCEGHPYSPYKCFNNTCMFYSYYCDPCVSDEQCETQKCRKH